MAARYRAFVEMAGYAEDNGFAMLTLEEHHGADNGWSPSPLIMAGLIFGRTKNIGVNISALLLPAARPAAGRGGHRRPRPRERRPPHHHPRHRVPAVGVRRPRQGLGRTAAR